MQAKTPEHSVIVLTYTRPDLAEARVREIERLYASRGDVEFILFANGPNLDARLALMGLEPSLLPNGMSFRKEVVQPNIGFGGGWNAAVYASRGRVIHLLSDDVRVTGDLLAAVDRAVLNWGGPDWIVGQQRVVDGGWNQFNGFTIPYLMGYYLAMPRTVWDELGGFDVETFHPYDFEDVDFSCRASEMGITLLTQPDLPLFHEVAGTIGYNPNRYEHTVKMRAAFARKHGLSNVPERP